MTRVFSAAFTRAQMFVSRTVRAAGARKLLQVYKYGARYPK